MITKIGTLNSYIRVKGASEHNLKGFDVDIPKNQLVVLTGISGSGKSSLAFDVLYQESLRRFSQAIQLPFYATAGGAFNRSRSGRPNVKSIQGLPPALGLTQMQGVAGKLSTVGTLLGASDLLRVYYSAFGEIHCRNCHISLKPLSSEEMCKRLLELKTSSICKILSPIVEKRKGAFREEIEKLRIQGYSKLRVNGKEIRTDESDLVLDHKKLNSISVVVDQLRIEPTKKYRLQRAVDEALRLSGGVVKVESEDIGSISFNASASCPICGEWAPKLDPRHFSHSSLGQCKICQGQGTTHPTLSSDLDPCPSCKGGRLDSHLPSVKLFNYGYASLHTKPISEMTQWLEQAYRDALGNKSKEKVVFELKRLIDSIMSLGLGHLNLGREGWTLSPGDLQRIRLCSIISNPLAGALYVLDEPCQGLTIHEVENLVMVIKKNLRMGSTILAVEHHPHFIKSADCIIEMGPGAGRDGGNIISIKSRKNKNLITKSDNLSLLQESHKFKNFIKFFPFEMRSVGFQNIDIAFNKINLIRGPSGSGKTTFVEHKLLPLLENLKNTKEIDYLTGKIIGNLNVDNIIDAKPASITRSSRRSVASVMDALPQLRKVYAALPISQTLGLTESHFSFQSKAGRCSKCQGKGYLELQYKYGPPIEIICDECNGARLNHRSLIPRFKGYSFHEILNIQISDLLSIFGSFKRILNKFNKVIEFGLGYLSLGQTLNTLSGGEIQRLILVSHMNTSHLAGNWFILWHPGTGLHTPDIKTLIQIMDLMVEQGATFVVVENREEFIKKHNNNIIF